MFARARAPILNVSGLGHSAPSETQRYTHAARARRAAQHRSVT